ncbi:TolB family protein [Streptomyces sp. NPDC048282]|uniref:TolB family protein n=1 Tax=Streptomyces sp. NPDC048282 TaxID=3365528 RepID=UPI0037214A21
MGEKHGSARPSGSLLRRTAATAATAALAVVVSLTAVPAASAADHDAVRRVSGEADGTQLTTASRGASLSADGRYAAYGVKGPRDGCPLSVSTCLFVKDLRTGRQTQVPGTKRLAGNPVLSADGRLLAFITGDGSSRPYLYDRATGDLTLLWPGPPPSASDFAYDGEVKAISADGRQVLYTVTYRPPGQPTQTRLLERDLATGTDTVVVPVGTADFFSGAGLSADGRYVAYGQYKESSGYQGLFVKDLRTGAVRRVDTARDGTPGDADSGLVRLSDDGRRVVFNSRSSNLTPESPTGYQWHPYARDLRTGRIEAFGSAGRTASAADGSARHVVLQEPGALVLRDLRTGRQRTIAPETAEATLGAVARHGREVVFASSAPDLVPDDTNGVSDVFLVHT